MKVTLILLNSWTAKSGNRFLQIRRGVYAPNMLRLLYSLTPKELNAEINVIDEDIEKLEIDKIEADIVGISVLTANAPRAYKIATFLRQKGIIVVLGGQHPTLLPEEASQYADAILIGFAENAWPKLLIDLKNGKLQKQYQMPWEETFQSNFPALPKFKKYSKKYLLPFSIEGTRGCLNSCKFCIVPGQCSNKLIKRPIQHIIKEIKDSEVKRIVFLDPGPTEDLIYAKNLYRALIPLKIKWFSCASMKVAQDDEWLDLAARSGCQGLLIGFESINPQSLLSEGKYFNKTETYVDFIKKLHKKNILVLGCFIFGFDEDSNAIFKETVEFVNKAKIDIVHYSILTPFPGTMEFQRLNIEGRILTKDWSRFDGTNVVFQPKKMTAEELLKGYHDAYNKTHSLYSIFKRQGFRRKNFLIRIMVNLGFKFYGKKRV